MNKLLKLEEAAQLALGIYFFYQMDISAWWFWGLFLAPDIGMLGYLVNTKTGAFTYNIMHHKGIAIVLWLIGLATGNIIIHFTGILLFSHASFDRVFGYGLKYPDSFHNTHLGRIGKERINS